MDLMSYDSIPSTVILPGLGLVRSLITDQVGLSLVNDRRSCEPARFLRHDITSGHC